MYIGKRTYSRNPSSVYPEIGKFIIDSIYWNNRMPPAKILLLLGIFTVSKDDKSKKTFINMRTKFLIFLGAIT